MYWKMTKIKNSVELFSIWWDTANERLGKLDYKSEEAIWTTAQKIKDGKQVRKVKDTEDTVRI